MNKSFFMLLLLASTKISFAQKKAQSPQPAKKTPTEVIVQEEKNIPFTLINLRPAKQLSAESISKIRSKGLNISDTYALPRSSEKNYMFDHFIINNENKESFLVDITGFV